MSQLGEQQFALHPIWSEFYDNDERHEIVSWGVDAQWLDEQLRGTDIGNDHWAYPVLRPEPLPERMRIYIGASFTTPTGNTLRGFVVNPDAYCLTVFAAQQNFTLSNHPGIADLTYRSVANLAKTLHTTSDALFPLRYETEFRDRTNNLIQGTFELPNRNT